MRLNKYLAAATGVSRRQADSLIESGRIQVNGEVAELGQLISETDTLSLDGKPIESQQGLKTIMLHKPVGYVCSRNGQGSKTVYELLPPSLHHLKPVGRLDKNSSGLLLLTNDGELANQLTHPRYAKTKIYKVTINKPLTAAHQSQIHSQGVILEDGISKLALTPQGSDNSSWTVTMQEGRNRQIRRTFSALGYRVTDLHRTDFGTYKLGDLKRGQYRELT